MSERASSRYLCLYLWVQVCSHRRYRRRGWLFASLLFSRMFHPSDVQLWLQWKIVVSPQRH